MSDFVRQVKQYYELGFWTEGRVKNAVVKGALTEEEYKQITGKAYSA